MPRKLRWPKYIDQLTNYDHPINLLFYFIHPLYKINHISSKSRISMSLYQSLCPPAKAYIVLAIIYIVGAYFSMNQFSNFMQLNQSKLHPYMNSLNFSVSQSANAVSIGNVLFTLFWTWVLNYLCSAGHIRVSWFLVLFPYLLLFIGLAVSIWTLLKMHIISSK